LGWLNPHGCLASNGPDITHSPTLREHDELTRFKDKRLIAGQRDGDMVGGILPCGQIAEAIKDLIDVAEFVPSMMGEAIEILQKLSNLTAGK
jgi:NAD(P)H-dependent flavin oxidoreductase YrpB (nitropropane dioxygenase family)